MNVYLNGFDRKEVTFKAGSDAKEGKTVNLLTKTTVDASPLDTNFLGICTLIRNGMASVVLRGYVTVAYSGTAPSLGYNKIASDGAGGIKVSDSGRDILVADIDAVNSTCGIVL